MRRFSQKNHLITLSDINITPLLDLAFVLLIIFIITTPLLEQNIKMTLPAGGSESTPVRKDQVRTIEVNPRGGYVVRGRQYSLQQLQELLVAEVARDPQLALYIRADKSEDWDNIFQLIKVCRTLNIKNYQFAGSVSGQ